MYFFLWFFMTWFFFFFLCRLYSHSWSNILVNRFAKSYRSWIPVIFLTSVLKSRYACFLFLWQAQLDLKKAQQQVWMVFSWSLSFFIWFAWGLFWKNNFVSRLQLNNLCTRIHSSEFILYENKNKKHVKLQSVWTPNPSKDDTKYFNGTLCLYM